MASPFVRKTNLPPSRSLSPRVGIVQDGDVIMYSEAEQKYVPGVVDLASGLQEYTVIDDDLTIDDTVNYATYNVIDSATITIPNVGSDGQELRFISTLGATVSSTIVDTEDNVLVVLEYNMTVVLKYIDGLWQIVSDQNLTGSNFIKTPIYDFTTDSGASLVASFHNKVIVKNVLFILTEIDTPGVVEAEATFGVNAPDYDNIVNPALSINTVGSVVNNIPKSGDISYFDPIDYSGEINIYINITTNSDAVAYSGYYIIEYMYPNYLKLGNG